MLFFALIALLVLYSTYGYASGIANTLEQRNSTGLSDAVTWDPHSISIQGQRIFILSAEIHPWRLPNPQLWRDIFDKVKANGFNAVSFYTNWALHYPTPDTNGGEGDFQEGTQRDIQAFITAAKDAGLWMIARPGPYINGETTGGGFPGWVGNIGGSLRTDNVNYTQAWTPYMNVMSKLIANNQITNGGPIILVQAENEFSAGTGRSDYMQAIIDTYRANDIVIPITFNDQHSGATGNFSPDLPGEGRVNIYCGDSYPQGANSWAQVQAIYYPNHEAVAWDNPLCLAEFGGGFLVGWEGTGALGGTGYEKYSENLTNAQYEDVFYKENYAQTATILNIYMLFGGTNWGQTAEPTVYTSYDYGGGINENRVACPKMNEMRLQGLFLRVSRDLLGANLISNGTNYTSTSLIHTAELRNFVTNAGFYFVRHNDSTSTTLTTTTLNVTTSAGSMTIPTNGAVALDGREMKIIVTDYVFGYHKTTMLYSTAEIMTWTTVDSVDYLILYAPAGQSGETAILFDSQPIVGVDDAPNVSTYYSAGVLVLNYTLDGTQFVFVEESGKSMVLVILDKATASQWHAPMIAGGGDFGNYFSIGSNETILVSGPYLVRGVSISGGTLALVGDTNGTTSLEIIAPSVVSSLTWNGVARHVSKSNHNTLLMTVNDSNEIPALPALGPWKVSGSLPEIFTSFDDSSFTTANLTSTNYTNLPPLSGSNVLYSQQYGFYGGNLIWRGHFNASGNERAFDLSVQGGFAFGYSAFFNGLFLGSNQGNATVSLTNDTWAIPNGTLNIGSDNVLTVLQDHMGIVETSTSSGKEPRGLRGYSIVGGDTSFTEWKVQGNFGGAAKAPDTFRGYLNEGGLYAERIGAHLPGFDDSAWPTGSLTTSGAGVNFFRTTFNPNIPHGTDVPIRLSITPSAKTSNFRVQIYLNGWQLGKYINNKGPQTVFVLPAGILLANGTNVLALSLWSLDTGGASIEGVRLVVDGAFASGYTFKDYSVAPDYDAQMSARPAPKLFDQA